MFPIHSYKYEPDKSIVKNLKKVIWNKKINNKNFDVREYEFMEENLVYNTISKDYSIMNINNFNILGDQKKY